MTSFRQSQKIRESLPPAGTCSQSPVKHKTNASRVMQVFFFIDLGVQKHGLQDETGVSIKRRMQLVRPRSNLAPSDPRSLSLTWRCRGDGVIRSRRRKIGVSLGKYKATLRPLKVGMAVGIRNAPLVGSSRTEKHCPHTGRVHDQDCKMSVRIRQTVITSNSSPCYHTNQVPSHSGRETSASNLPPLLSPVVHPSSE